MKWIEMNEITQNEIDECTIWMQRHGRQSNAPKECDERNTQKWNKLECDEWHEM